MKVYVLVFGDEIGRVFVTREKAEKHLELSARLGAYGVIKETELVGA